MAMFLAGRHFVGASFSRFRLFFRQIAFAITGLLGSRLSRLIRVGTSAFATPDKLVTNGKSAQFHHHLNSDCNSVKSKSPIPAERLSDAVIFDILTDPSPQPVLSARHKCSASAVGRIRRGELHPDVHPEIPRYKSAVKTGRKTCPKCIYYTGDKRNPCDLGHTDPLEEGLTFASYCTNFAMVESKT